MIKEGYRLFGCGDLNDYGEYTLVVADSKEMAYELLSKFLFEKWKKHIYEYKENSHFDSNGKPLNGCAYETIENTEKGFFQMNDEQLFAHYKNELFKIEEVVDLKTNVWDDEHA
jgi:hypothetical protein